MLLVTQLSVASGVFRIGVGASLLIFLFVFLVLFSLLTSWPLLT